jgi:hypothetical protein
MAKAKGKKSAAGTGSGTGQPPPATDGSSSLPQSDPKGESFTPRTLDRTIIAVPLLERIINAKATDEFDIIIDVNLEYSGGRSAARQILWGWIDALPDVLPSGSAAAGLAAPGPGPGTGGSVPGGARRQGIDASKSKYTASNICLDG